jgi:hypothetical protein
MQYCQYKNALGEPGVGIHEKRIPYTNTAAADYLMSIGGAWLLTASTKMPLVLTTILVLVLGEVFHYMFCIPTQTLKYLQIL